MLAALFVLMFVALTVTIAAFLVDPSWWLLGGAVVQAVSIGLLWWMGI